MTLYRGYTPASRCTGGPRPGALALMAWFLGVYGASGGRNGGIYGCAKIPGSDSWSVHAEGRAADLMIPVGAAWGFPLADSFRQFSGELGVQLLIYRRKVWSGRYPDAGWRDYLGSNPHDDHIHNELSVEAAKNLTAEHVASVLIAPAGTPSPSGSWEDQLVAHLPQLQRGETGRYVRRLQGLLMGNFYPPAGGIDGDFGPGTETAVRSFQSAAGVGVDGVVGPRTWGALLG